MVDPSDPHRPADAIDVANLYLLVLGRRPESVQTVEAKVGRPLDALLDDLLASPEFESGVGRALSSGARVRDPQDAQAPDAVWAASNLAVERRLLDDVDLSSWERLRIACFRDAAFRAAHPGAPRIDPGADPDAASGRYGDLFDAHWYARRNPEAGGAGGALDHYLEHGGAGRRDPSPLFQTAWYLHEDRGWSPQPGETPLDRYLTHGQAHGLSPHPLFDSAHYVSQAPAAADAPLAHYLSAGAHGRHDPGPLFAQRWYRETYMADAPADMTPLRHFTEAWSDPEAVRPRPSPHPLIELEEYLARNSDVASFSMGAIAHYLLHGREEGRATTPLFDGDFYRQRHPEDEEAQLNPFNHYLAHGDRPGFDPNPFFDSTWYAAHRDLGGRTALEHFLVEGRAVGASPHPLWDAELYERLNPDIADAMQSGGVGEAYRHFVEYGAAELDAGEIRRFAFAWGEAMLEYDRDTYLADNPDVALAISAGRARTPLEHLFTLGHREARNGLRAIYGPQHRIRLLRSRAGAAPGGAKHLCLFAHYDRDGVIAPYVVTFVQNLAALDMDVVFITAVTDDEELDKVGPFVSRLLIKNDTGRDFGSWVLALEVLGADCGARYERVIFANDSFYFPVRPVPNLMEQMQRSGYNLFGLSDSRQDEIYHIQSYFLAFDRKAQVAAFPHLMENFRKWYALNKYGQIREFEYGLTRMVQEAGLSVGALLSIDDVRELLIHDPRNAAWAPLVRLGLGGVNPAHQLFEFAIGRLGWPGLKVELLRDNPLQVTGLGRVRGLIADGGVPYEQIRRHQKRIARPPRVRPVPIRPLPPPPTVELVERLPGDGALYARRLVLFAHYDPDGVLDPHVLHQLRSLAAADCTIVLVTSSTDPEELAKASPFVREVIVKTEAGRDFGSWALALRLLGQEVERFDTVVWMNDSTYFPLFDPAPMFDQMSRDRADFWGVVDSENVTWHVMSWFWAFRRSAVRAGWLDWFTREYNPSHTKWGQIHNYEMRLPRLVRASGLRAAVYVPSSKIAAAILERDPDDRRAAALRSGRFNIMHDTWEEAIVDGGCPSIKVELVRDNPLGIDLSRMLEAVKAHTAYDPELIRRHMLRLKCRHLPPPSAGVAPAGDGAATPVYKRDDPSRVHEERA